MLKPDETIIFFIIFIIIVNILTGKYFNFNVKCIGNTFNKPNKLVSVQFNNI